MRLALCGAGPALCCYWISMQPLPDDAQDELQSLSVKVRGRYLMNHICFPPQSPFWVLSEAAARLMSWSWYLDCYDIGHGSVGLTFSSANDAASFVLHPIGARP